MEEKKKVSVRDSNALVSVISNFSGVLFLKLKNGRTLEFNGFGSTRLIAFDDASFLFSEYTKKFEDGMLEFQSDEDHRLIVGSEKKDIANHDNLKAILFGDSFETLKKATIRQLKVLLTLALVNQKNKIHDSKSKDATILNAIQEERNRRL